MRASKIRGGPRHIQLAGEAVRKGGGAYSKMPPETTPGTAQGDVRQGLAKRAERRPGPTTQGFLGEEKQPAPNLPPRE